MDVTPPDGVRLRTASVSLLIVDDDAGCARAVARALRQMGYRVQTCAGGSDPPLRVNHSRFDVILLDVRLEDESGIDVCRWLRRNQYRGSVIMISGDASKATVADALDCGADDYVIKPVDLRELRARIEAARRRSERPGAPPFVIAEGRVFLDGVPTTFSGPELEFLRRLWVESGKTVARSDFYDLVRKAGNPGHAVDLLAQRVRDKLGKHAWRIKCDRGIGFFLLIL